jgi:hypothetical protein
VASAPLPSSTSRAAWKAWVVGRAWPNGCSTPGMASMGLKTPENDRITKVVAHARISALCPKRSSSPMTSIDIAHATSSSTSTTGASAHPTSSSENP